MRWFLAAALSLGLPLLLQGCCPGPQAFASGTWARTRTGVEPGVLAVLDLDRNLIATPPAEDKGTRSSDGLYSVVKVKLWLEGAQARTRHEQLRLSPLFIRQQQGQVVAQYPLPEEAFRDSGTLELTLPLKSGDGKPLPRGQYALQVFLQGPEDLYPTLAQVDLVVTGCEFY
jgi:hypothetical protein